MELLSKEMTMSQRFALESNLEEKFNFDADLNFDEMLDKYVKDLSERIESGDLAGSFELFSDGGAYIVYYGCMDELIDFAVRENDFWDGLDNISLDEIAELVEEQVYPIAG